MNIKLIESSRGRITLDLGQGRLVRFGGEAFKSFAASKSWDYEIV